MQECQSDIEHFFLSQLSSNLAAFSMLLQCVVFHIQSFLISETVIVPSFLVWAKIAFVSVS